MRRLLLLRSLARLEPGKPFRRSGDTIERAAEIREIDECQQQTRDPEDVHVGEEGKQAQHGDDLELQLVPAMGHALGQGVDAQEQQAEGDDGDKQENAGAQEHGIGPVRTWQEEGQVMG